MIRLFVRKFEFAQVAGSKSPESGGDRLAVIVAKRNPEDKLHMFDSLASMDRSARLRDLRCASKFECGSFLIAKRTYRPAPL